VCACTRACAGVSVILLQQLFDLCCCYQSTIAQYKLILSYQNKSCTGSVITENKAIKIKNMQSITYKPFSIVTTIPATAELLYFGWNW